MPTIIDALIVELQLDPKNFNQGQQAAVNSLRQLQQTAQASAAATASAVTKGLQANFAGINQQFTQANQHLGAIAAAARRSGQAVGAAGKEGASGITSLTTSALAAYSALKALQGLYHSVTSTAASGAAIGRIVPEIGGSSRFIQNFANAAKVAVNADPAAVMEDMRSLEMDLQKLAHRGEMSGRLKEMTIGGVAINQGDSIETVMRRVEENLASKSSPAEAAMWAQQYGLSRDTGRFLRTGPAAVNTAMNSVSARALTEDQIQSLQRLQSAENAVEGAYVHLWQTIAADLSKSGLAPALEGLASLTDNLSHNETELRLVEVAVGAVTVATSVGLLGAVGKLIISLNALWALPAWRALVWMAGAAAGGAGLLRFLGPAGAAIGTMTPGIAGSQSEIENDRILRSGGRGKYDGPGGGGGLAGSRKAVLNIPKVDNMTDEERNFLGLVLKYESGGGHNVMNNVGLTNGVSPTQAKGYTAQGYYQILNSNWAAYAPGLGITAPNAMAASFRDQTRVALAMYRKSGKGPWADARWNPYLLRAVQQGERAQFAGEAGDGGGGVPLGTTVPIPSSSGGTPRYNKETKADLIELDHRITAWEKYNQDHPDEQVSFADYTRALSMVRAHRAQRAAGVSTTTNTTHNGGDTHVGSINVHTQATDGAGVVSAIGSAVKRNALVNQANTGLE
jgi:hypothetical protein